MFLVGLFLCFCVSDFFFFFSFSFFSFLIVWLHCTTLPLTERERIWRPFRFFFLFLFFFFSFLPSCFFLLASFFTERRIGLKKCSLYLNQNQKKSRFFLVFSS